MHGSVGRRKGSEVHGPRLTLCTCTYARMHACMCIVSSVCMCLSIRLSVPLVSHPFPLPPPSLQPLGCRAGIGLHWANAHAARPPGLWRASTLHTLHAMDANQTLFMAPASPSPSHCFRSLPVPRPLLHRPAITYPSPPYAAPALVFLAAVCTAGGSMSGTRTHSALWHAQAVCAMPICLLLRRWFFCVALRLPRPTASVIADGKPQLLALPQRCCLEEQDHAPLA